MCTKNFAQILNEKHLNIQYVGRLGGSVGWVSDFGSGHDVTVHEFETHVRLCADSSEPGACFRFCLPLSLSLPCLLSHSLPLSLSKINKH